MINGRATDVFNFDDFINLVMLILNVGGFLTVLAQTLFPQSLVILIILCRFVEIA